ncbi:Retrovirus-related Pol polyprotein from transposon opus [Ceratobasidium sp. AG-Ba]|nr:Retrovirus-related Pol polyprotein from transposon opus [Ceratobasidium sp. AG-Ba]
MRVRIGKGASKCDDELWSTVDGGSMLCVLDSTVWALIKHSFGRLRTSDIICRMANGACVPSKGTGVGVIRLDEATWPIRFEVIDSKGAFELLLGKDWLSHAGAKQIFATDSLSLCTPAGRIEIKNSNPQKRKPLGPRPLSIQEPSPVVSEAGVESSSVAPGEPVPRRSARLRQRRGSEANPFWVAESALLDFETLVVEESDQESVTEAGDELWQRARAEVEEETMRAVLMTEPTVTPVREDRLHEVVERAKRTRERERGPVDIAVIEQLDKPTERPVTAPPVPDSERRSNPFKQSRVAEILRKVRIGDGIDAEQRSRVKALVSEYADVFALSLSEVLPVSITEMKLDIPEDATFPKRAGQRKLSEPQRQALYAMLDELEEAKIVERVTQDQVAAVSPINMVPKPGGAERPDIETLQRMANSECRKYGFEVKYPDAGFYEDGEEQRNTQPAKWRLVQNFAAVNKVTQIRPFPMGDLAAKQRAVAGHKFVSVMDLQAGFHAIPIARESIPYTGFYVEGRGHYVYLRMPFGLTGAPTTFCEMVATAFHGLIGKILEVWMDDMATAADDFEDGLVNLRTIFERARAHNISLSASKTVLFMSEAPFAGAQVSERGISMDLRKVKAILEIPEPNSVLEVMKFLGMTGAYRPKIKNYARTAQPLSDLTRNVRTADLAGKNAFEYKRALKETKVELSEEGKRAFVDLKTTLTTDPVLRAPVYDDRPFVVTTNGSKYGFGAVLSQVWEEQDGSGGIKKVTYPIAFASKRTSRTEEKYIPFLLEFAALKFALDEFDDIIFGRAIELEMDCKALADLLGNTKLNSTHERWRNLVADALSRVYEHRPDDNSGPGRLRDVDPGWESAKELINDMYLLLDDDRTAALLSRFQDDEYFLEIIVHLLFEAGDGHPWTRKRSETESGGRTVPRATWLKTESFGSLGVNTQGMAKRAGGHFGRDLTILTLQQEYHWPRMRQHATEAVTTCPRCKNFGPRLLSALLRPITRARPFDLLVGDYVSLPEGYGGYKTVLVLVDVYSRYLFAFPSKKPGTGKFTVDALTKVSDLIAKPKSFMADGGSHFDCDEVRRWCESQGTQPLTTPAYAPWTNGLAEGTIKLLVGRLKKLCAPDVGETPDAGNEAASTPTSWPKHLTTAVSQLNDRLLDSLGYSPRELLTGMLSADRKAELNQSVLARALTDIDINMGLTYALRDDAHANALEHARKRKRAFDKKARVVNYLAGDLVQKYDARLDETHSTVRKLAPRWSGPLRIVSRAANSYELEDLAGNTYSKAAHSRLLRPFHPRPGTTLADYAASLSRARQANKTASRPDQLFEQSKLPQSPRMESRVPLDRDDPTQPNKYQDEDDDLVE